MATAQSSMYTRMCAHTQTHFKDSFSGKPRLAGCIFDKGLKMPSCDGAATG